MKRVLAVLAIMLLAVTWSVTKAQKFYYGLQAGLDLSHTHIADRDKYTYEKRVFSPLLLFNVNAYIGFRGDSFFGCSFEPGYIRKGGVQTDVILKSGDMLFGHQDLKCISSFIQFPVTADFYITKRFSVSAGPEIDLLLSTKEESQDLSFYTSGGNDKFDFSGNISFCFNVTDNIDIRLLYNHSITSSSYYLWIDELGYYIGSSKQYYQYLQLTLRFKTGLVLHPSL